MKKIEEYGEEKCREQTGKSIDVNPKYLAGFILNIFLLNAAHKRLWNTKFKDIISKLSHNPPSYLLKESTPPHPPSSFCLERRNSTARTIAEGRSALGYDGENER
jgi:hypothetical protein